MTKARLDGLYILLLGCVVFILFGTVLERSASAPLLDFRALYYPARCLLQHHDPYKESEVSRIYLAEGVYGQTDTARDRLMSTRYVYLPSTFSFTVPFAMLPWGLAHILWMVLTAGILILASFLMWDIAADYAPVISGCLIGFLVANSEVLLMQGMCAGIAVSLCVVAVWCFFRNRFVPAGILCLAISLAIKPQDTGLVWFYFLLAGGVLRKYAMQSLLATVTLSTPAALWVWHIAPNWIQELQSNIATFFVHGGLNDPGPTSAGSHGLAMVVSLQAVISVFRDDPGFYNLVTYLICGSLLLMWMAMASREHKSGPGAAWFALASIAVLSMLPVYHRQYDAKLLLLSIPACAILWARGGAMGRIALLVNTAGVVLTGDFTWAIILGLISRLHPSKAGLAAHVLTAAQVFPAPLILLSMCVFYLWAMRLLLPAGTTPPTLKEHDYQ